MRDGARGLHVAASPEEESEMTLRKRAIGRRVREIPLKFKQSSSNEEATTQLLPTTNQEFKRCILTTTTTSKTTCYSPKEFRCSQDLRMQPASHVPEPTSGHKNKRPIQVSSIKHHHWIQKYNRFERWIHLVATTSALFVIYYCLIFMPQTAHCQRGKNFQDISGQRFAAALLPQESPALDKGTSSSPQSPLIPSSSATLNQLVSILQSYAAQNGQVGGARGRLPLGLVPRGLQPALQQPQQISTPIQLQQQQQQPQQQSNGRRPLTFSNQQGVQMISSSPSTPFLQLNRIAAASAAQSQLVPNGRPPFGGQIPVNNMQQQPWLRQPQQEQQQQQQQQQRIFTQTQSLTPTRAIQPIPVLVPRPQAGFAPSGPPPSSGANQAMVVVQSPVATNNRSTDQAGSSKNMTISSSSSSTTPSSTSDSPVVELSTTEQPVSSSTNHSVNEIDIPLSSNKNSSATEPTNWNPLDAASSSGGNASSNSTEDPMATRNQASLAPSPDIVTVPPGYNPDTPPREQQTYDIPVSAQIGPNNKFSLTTTKLPDATIDVSSSWSSSTTPIPSIAPTAVTTIIWTPPASESSEIMATGSQTPTGSSVVQSTRAHSIMNSSSSSVVSPSSAISPRLRDIQPTPVQATTGAAPTKVTDPSAGVVYGKPEARDSKPAAPADSLASGQPFIQSVQLDNQVRPFAGAQLPPVKSQHSASGRPSRPINSMAAGTGLQLASGFQISNHHATNQSLGDIQDYLSAQPPLVLPSAGGSGSSSSHVEPTISAHGGLDPTRADLPSAPSISSAHRSSIGSNGSSLSASSIPAITASTPQPQPPVPANSELKDTTLLQQPPQPRLRRPTFKPRPAVPPIRIDSCIVDDDSSCDPDNNERCVTEYGISSCHCKPGYARLSQLRGFCSPIDAFQLHLKIDRLSDDRRLVYNHTLADPNSEEYQYLEFEAQQALAGAFQQSPNVKQLFMGARINKFYEKKGKVWANISLHLGSNNDTTSADKIQNQVTQELVSRLTGPSAKSSPSQRPLGDSTIMLDGSRESVSRLTDVNECSSRELNDCSKFATCSNDFGTFHCQCMPGYEDKHLGGDPRKQGRVCLGCSPSYCSNRGECSIIEGERRCKCRPNFIGARCDVDTEVLAVAVGGSFIGLIILLGTFWCLFVFNRRWRREQQKLDAMSATSGLTYNYVNSASTNSLMSPTRNTVGGSHHRSGGHHQMGATAAAYGQRIGAALAGNGAPHYAADQQAIIGSTSSGSSAASHQQLCAASTYGATHAVYQQQQQQYEDGGLLIAPASTGSSQQTSPTSNSYRNLHITQQQQLIPGSAYTLSGHHYQHQAHQHHHQMKPTQLSQFHPAVAGADYRTLAGASVAHQYDSRWRTLQQEHANQNGSLGYYLSPDMLVGGQQQVYASPQRELCIDTTTGNHNKSRRQQGRSGGVAIRSKSHGPHNTLYYNQSDYN